MPGKPKCERCRKTIVWWPCGMQVERNVAGCYRPGRHFHRTCGCRDRKDEIVEQIPDAR